MVFELLGPGTVGTDVAAEGGSIGAVPGITPQSFGLRSEHRLRFPESRNGRIENPDPDLQCSHHRPHYHAP